MFQTRPVVPPYYMPQDYQTPPHTPAPGMSHSYFSPRQYSYPSTPNKGHTRRATQDAGYSTYRTTYATTSPRKSYYDAEPEFSSPGYYSSAYSTPKHRTDYVSDHDRNYAGARYSYSYRVPADKDSRKPRRHSSSKHHSYPRSPYVSHDYDDYEEFLPRYEKSPTRPPPYERHQSYHHGARADYYRYDQVPQYAPADSSSRPRRASGASKPTYASQPRPRTSTAAKPPPQATEEDARRAGIPAGYSYKNWDPTEEPILLLGSVFDANSLGKWIYDWTVFFFGAATPMTEVAGELWLLLIQLAGKIKRAEDTMSRIRQTKSRDLVDEFLDSGERLWQRFNKLLKICENYMWKAAKKESRDAKKVTMGKNSGCEFVDAIFGRDRELERTEKLMTGIRLWSMRFDANVGPILAAPHE